MVQYKSVNIKVQVSQLNKLKSIVKNKTWITSND